MKFIQPSKMCTYGATVTGTVETGYVANSLCDGDPHNPVRTTSTGASFNSSGTSTAGVNGVVLANTNLDGAKNVTISGGVSGTLVTPTVPGDGIPLNGWKEVTPATTGSVNISVSGNSVTVVLGELIAGVLETIGLLPGSDLHPEDYRVAGDSVIRRVGYDMGYTGRTLEAQMILTAADKDKIVAWYDATRQGSRPSVLIPDENVNDAWLVIFTNLDVRPWENDNFQVSATWAELTRVRW